ncbi:protocadherin-8 isoform X1 [Pelobates cultripes]|uniref:Protocadherin-8 n=1 Tax=Pelobates cultripes TaxID=61616 RepID=A0AAD1VN25_PELCU|nr:protocadherin-8 isoform X1 [Pelobates cultripes]
MTSKIRRCCSWDVSLKVLLLSLLLPTCTCKTMRYRTFEEDEPGTVIGTLAEDMHLNIPGEGRFRLMKQFNNSLIHVRESDGQLSIGERIDREQICKQTLNCILALDVVSFSKEQFKLIHVEVEVRDINDNSPQFPSDEIPVEVSESAAVGTRIPLDIAIDEDVGSNSIQSFQISVNSHFSLDVQTRADGVKYADLVLMKELDRESQSSYTLELVAMDGGSPSRSGSAVVSVRVMDFNDNSPTFERSSVTVELMEDSPLGYLLLDLNAVDPDEGVNGEIVYSFSPQVSQEVRHLFKIDPKSGRLTLEGQVDFETKQTYEFDVQAQDISPNPLTATCKVIVHILDVNDNAPAISITPLTSISSGVAYITEAAAKDSFVALISTTDRDSGPNGQVHCTLYGHDHFKLQQAYEDSFMIVTTSPLDREKIAEYNLTVVAEDLGSPPFKTIKQYTIRVSDENDNAPVFAKPVYEVSVLENNAPGAYITTVVARDPDLGHNGKVIYRLVDTEIMGAPISTYVSLDPATGSIYALRTFNYEILKQLDLRIQASDGGSPQLTSSANIKVKIVDQNDNAPAIVHPVLSNGSAEVGIPARAPHGYLVTQIKAKDADEGVNSELMFSLSEERAPIFTLNKVTGEIFLTADLSGELGQVFRTLVTVTDSGRPSLSTTATISFLVTGATPPVNHEVMQPSPWEEKVSHWDVPLIVIIVLAGSCTLLLAAIITIATTCNKRRKEMKADAKNPRDISELEKGEQDDEELIDNQNGNLFDARPFPNATQPFTGNETAVTPEVVASTEESFGACLYDSQKRLRTTNNEGYAQAPAYGKEAGTTVTVWKGHSFNTISIREAEKFSGKDSGKGDSDFNDSDSDISGDALKKDLINHMQTGLWACTTECKILGHSDRCWSPSCGRPQNVHPATMHTGHGQLSVSSFCKSTSLPRDPLHRENYYQSSPAQAHLAKTGALPSVYEKVVPKDYESRTINLISPPRSGRLPDLQEITMPLYKSPGSKRYAAPSDSACEQDEL